MKNLMITCEMGKEQGRICPDCGKPTKQCISRKQKKDHDKINRKSKGWCLFGAQGGSPAGEMYLRRPGCTDHRYSPGDTRKHDKDCASGHFIKISCGGQANCTNSSIAKDLVRALKGS